MRWSSPCDILYFCGICGKDEGGAALFYPTLFYFIEWRKVSPSKKERKKVSKKANEKRDSLQYGDGNDWVVSLLMQRDIYSIKL